MILNTMFKIIFSLVVFFSSLLNVSGQGKVSISAGAGFPELINTGVRYRFNNTQTGLRIGCGWIEGFQYFMNSVSADFYYHFAGSSKFSDMPSWYMLFEFSYFKKQPLPLDHTYYTKKVFLDYRIGREINLSKRIGIYTDAGIGLPLFVSKNPASSTYFKTFPVIIGIGIGLFYRL